MPSERRTLTVREAAEILGCSVGVAYAAVRAGQLPSIRLGPRRVVIPRARLLELLGEAPTPESANGTPTRVPPLESFKAMGPPLGPSA
jgi:excisionase family DNA binding protein